MKRKMYIHLQSNKFPDTYFTSYTRMVRCLRDMLDVKNNILFSGFINNRKSSLCILAYKTNNGLWINKHIHICYYDMNNDAHWQDIVYSGELDYLAGCLR